MNNKKVASKKITRRKAMQYGAYSTLAAGLSLSGCDALLGKKKKPNVLLIVLDTARADRFSCLGYNRPTTPYIDTLASEGAVYENAYSTCFWTLPSHASLFTGLYPSRAWATSETNHLPDFNTTVAKLLKADGYNTAAYSCNTWVSKERGFAQGFNEFTEMWRTAELSRSKGVHKKREFITAERITDWIDQKQNRQSPFFLFANFNCAHSPYRPPEPFKSKFLRSKYDQRKIDRVSNIAEMWDHYTGHLKLDPTDFKIMSDLYDGEIAVADHCVEMVVERLRKHKILDDTIVIITSDHGENLGEHGLTDHLLSLYETTIHIPLIIRYPERFKAGTRNSNLASLVDIAPTIIDLCNTPGDLRFLKTKEVSLASMDRIERKFVFAENERPTKGIMVVNSRYPKFDTSKIDCRMRAIRTKQHKFIWSIGKNKQLYDLTVDPYELFNINDSSPQVSKKLEQLTSIWMEQNTSTGIVAPLEGRDAESLEILRSLGYVK